jgi:hypothetical protein
MNRRPSPHSRPPQDAGRSVAFIRILGIPLREYRRFSIGTQPVATEWQHLKKSRFWHHYEISSQIRPRTRLSSSAKDASHLMVLALQSPGPHGTVRRAMPLAKLILRALSDKERANAKSQLRLLRLYAVRGGSVLNKLAEMLKDPVHH